LDSGTPFGQEEDEDRNKYFHDYVQCRKSALVPGSGSSILSKCGSGSRVFYDKNLKKFGAENVLEFIFSEIAIYLS
jgi:hypothetical protein